MLELYYAISDRMRIQPKQTCLKSFVQNYFFQISKTFNLVAFSSYPLGLDMQPNKSSLKKDVKASIGIYLFFFNHTFDNVDMFATVKYMRSEKTLSMLDTFCEILNSFAKSKGFPGDSGAYVVHSSPVISMGDSAFGTHVVNFESIVGFIDDVENSDEFKRFLQNNQIELQVQV